MVSYFNRFLRTFSKRLVEQIETFNNLNISASDIPLTEQEAFASVTCLSEDADLKSVAYWKNIEEVVFRIVDLNNVIATMAKNDAYNGHGSEDKLELWSRLQRRKSDMSQRARDLLLEIESETFFSQTVQTDISNLKTLLQ